MCFVPGTNLNHVSQWQSNGAQRYIPCFLWSTVLKADVIIINGVDLVLGSVDQQEPRARLVECAVVYKGILSARLLQETLQVGSIPKFVT
jgi:ribose 1,5-bisphosphokinase PhnN